MLCMASLDRISFEFKCMRCFAIFNIAITFHSFNRAHYCSFTGNNLDCGVNYHQLCESDNADQGYLI